MNTGTSTMNDINEPAPLVALPTDLDDAAAAKLLEFFYQAARTLESHYAGQLLRHAHQPDERQCSLWDDDPPF